MEKKPIKVTEYANGVTARLKNRRITVLDCSEEKNNNHLYFIKTERRGTPDLHENRYDDEHPEVRYTAHQEHSRAGITRIYNGVMLSDEALYALYAALTHYVKERESRMIEAIDEM